MRVPRLLVPLVLLQLVVGGLASNLPVSAIGAANFITIGSTRQQVVDVLGPPDSLDKIFDSEIWRYKPRGLGLSSSITFTNGRLSEWDENAVPLNISIGQAQPRAENIRPGVSRAAVVAALGTPQALDRIFDAETWRYKPEGLGLSSSVDFGRGHVTGWDQNSVDLRLGAGPNGRFIADADRASGSGTYAYKGVNYPVLIEQDIYSVNVDRSGGSSVRPIGPLLTPQDLGRVWPAGQPTYIRQFPKSTTFPGCGENGTCYGEISAATGRSKTVYVHGYFRRDGTYVRSHYRSPPRR